MACAIACLVIMRVGIVCPYSLGVWGGVQGQVLGLGRSLRRMGIATQILAPCDGPPPEPWVTPLGISIPVAENGSMAPIAPDPPAQLRVLGAIWDERFDILHLHEPLAPGPTLTSLVVKPVPLIGTFHASGAIFPYRYMKPVVRRLANRLDHRVAVSPEAARTAELGLGGSYEILYNGIETTSFGDVDPAPTEGPTVFFIARHEERKGLRILLEAASKLPAEVVVWIGGTGPETDKLRAAHADNHRLRWLGRITDRDKAARLKASSVFCVPSLGGESFGVVLLEGMAERVPVVASDLQAYRDVSANGAAATLYPANSAEALAGAIMEALEGGQTVSSRVMAGEGVARRYAMDTLAELYVERYEMVLASSRSRA